MVFCPAQVVQYYERSTKATPIVNEGIGQSIGALREESSLSLRQLSRKALAWLGHSSSDMLELYHHLHDDDSQRAMQQLAASAEQGLGGPQPESPIEGNLRATGVSNRETRRSA
jgi:hypothetical protein